MDEEKLTRETSFLRCVHIILLSDYDDTFVQDIVHVQEKLIHNLP